MLNSRIVRTTAKICLMCRKNKSLHEFHNNWHKSDGKQASCAECLNNWHRKHYAKSIGKTKDEIRRHGIMRLSGKIINGKKLCSYCHIWKEVSCFAKSLLTICELSSGCKKCLSMSVKVISKILKMEFILAYGKNGGCSCCGENRIELLTVEHVRGKGHILLEGYSVTNLMYKLKKLNWPVGYDCLCYNCNCSSKQGRPCCHTKEYKVYEQELEKFLEHSSQKSKYYDLKNKLKQLNGG